jgi:hypothetical protein
MYCTVMYCMYLYHFVPIVCDRLLTPLILSLPVSLTLIHIIPTDPPNTNSFIHIHRLIHS